MITSLNLLAGIAALLYTLDSNYFMGAIMVLVAVVMDGLDGKVARWLGSSSELGKQLDSLSDLVSFGVAPMVLMFAWQLHVLGIVGILITMLFPLCGAIRLARFNIMNISGYFVGLPITMGGALVALLVLFAENLPVMVLALIVLIIAFFMVSTIKFPKW